MKSIKRVSFPVALLAVLVLALVACGQQAQVRFDMSGTFETISVVTATTFEGSAVGDTRTFDLVFTVDGENVTAVAPNGATLTGTRSGNTAIIGRTAETNGVAFESTNFFTWSGDDVFTGTALIEYSDGSVTDLDVTGTRKQ